MSEVLDFARYHYAKKMFDPAETIAELVMSALPKGVNFDTIVVRGSSGIALGPAVANILGVNCAIVRKDHDMARSGGSHSYNRVGGRLGKTVLFLDDFISSGRTLRATMEGIKEALTNNQERVNAARKYGEDPYDGSIDNFKVTFVGTVQYERYPQDAYSGLYAGEVIESEVISMPKPVLQAVKAFEPEEYTEAEPYGEPRPTRDRAGMSLVEGCDCWFCADERKRERIGDPPRSEDNDEDDWTDVGYTSEDEFSF